MIAATTPQPELSSVGALQAAGELRALQLLRLAATGTADLAGVEESIATALTEGLGFPSAIVGLVDDAELRVGGWRGVGLSEALPLPALPIEDGGLLARAFRHPGMVVRGELGDRRVAVCALTFRNQRLGLLAVEPSSQGLAERQRAALERFSEPAGEVLAGVRMCVDRTRRLAVEAERTRISIEMHDAVIQSLFAISCTLEGCARAVESIDSEQARRLDDCRLLAERTLAQVRQSIYDLWPAELLERQFLGRLRERLAELASPDSPLELEWEARGHLADLSREARHILLAVAEEAISNVVRHARAHWVGVVLDAGSDPVRLQITDHGCGMAQDAMRPQFGIRGMRARLVSLGGALEIDSRPGSGTTVKASVPRMAAISGGS